MRPRKIEITIESYEILVIKQRDNLSRIWCPRCGKRVAAISLNDAPMAGLTIETARRPVEIGQLHLFENVGGQSLICLDSLTQNLKGEL